MDVYHTGTVGLTTTGTKLGLNGNGEQNCGFILDSLLEFDLLHRNCPLHCTVHVPCLFSAAKDKIMSTHVCVIYVITNITYMYM